MPALPLDEAGKYVAAAYLVFLLLVLIYVAIMAAKLSRIERQVGELVELAEGDSVRGAIDNGALEAPRREAGRSPAVQEQPEADRSREAGGRESRSERGAGSPAEVTDQDAGLEAPRVQGRPEADQPSQDAGLEAPRS